MESKDYYPIGWAVRIRLHDFNVNEKLYEHEIDANIELWTGSTII